MINGLYAYNGSDRIRRLANLAELSVAGDWNSTVSYFSNAYPAVYVANATYIAIRDNSNSYPTATTGLTNPACWSPLVLLSQYPSQGLTAIVIGGNTAGTSGGNINGVLMLAGANNITLSQQSNSISFIGGAGGGGGGAAISAGPNSQNTGTVVFSNSNGVSFGLATNGKLTVSYTVPNTAGLISSINLSAGTTSNNLSAVTFSNSNGVSFGLNANSVMTASVETNYQTPGAYLTTAMQSDAVTLSNINVSAPNASANLSNLAFGNAGGVSFALLGSTIAATVRTDYQSAGPYLTTAMQSNAATISNINVSGGTTSSNVSAITFSNSNGVSFGFNGSTITASVQTNYQTPGPYLTTAMQSQSSSVFAKTGFTSTTTGGTAIVATHDTNGLSMGVPAFLTTAMQSNAATISNINVSAGSTSSNISALTFANSNGVSFGLGTGASAGQVTATVQTNYLTTAALSSQTLQFSLGGNSATTNSSQISNGAFVLAGGNNLTIQQSNNTISFSVGNYITTADLSQNSSKYAGTGFTSTTTAGTAIVGTHNTSGLSLGVPAYLTTAMQSNAATISNINVSAGSTSTNASAYTFSNANGVSFGIGTGASAGVITGSVNPGVANINVSAGTTSTNAAAFTFSNANGVSFGLGTGASAGQVTATVATNYQSQGAYLTTAAQSTQTLAFSLSGNTATTNSSQIANGGFALAGGNNVTLQQSNNTVSISVGNYITTAALSTQTLGFSLGGNSATTNSSRISNGGFILAGGNNLTIQQSNNTVSLSVGNYITTAMQSNAATISNVNISAGSTSTNASAFTFSNSNGVSFGIGTGASAGVITASAAGGGVAISAGTNSQNTGTVSFKDANGISWGLDTNGSLTATVQTNYLTTAALSSQTILFSLSGNIATTNSSQISNGAYALAGGNNVTLQQSNNTISFSVGNYITTADLSQNSSKYAGTNGAITGGSITVNTSGISVNLPAYITTAAQSTQTLQFTLGGNIATTNSSQIGNGGFILAGGNNLTVQQSNNTVSFSVGNYITTAMQSNAVTISNVKISAGASSSNVSAITFSNANNVTFGYDGTNITASAGNTASTFKAGLTNSGNTAGTTGFADQQLVIVGAGALSMSQSMDAGSHSATITVSVPAYTAGYYEPFMMTNTALFGPGAGSWYFVPFIAPEQIGGGRLNLLHVNTSTAGLFIDITGASYVSSSTGTLAQSYTYSKAVALFSQGSGTNSTRLESFWSNSFSFGWSKSVVVQVSNASNINITVAHSLSYISEIGSNGAYTLNQYANSTATSVANSSTSSGQFSGVATSIRNMLSNSIIEPIGFNTTIQPGAYWLAFAWSSTRATASTGGLLGSAPDFSVSSELGISRLVLESAFRNWGSTATTARSHIMPYGLFTAAANMAPPSTLAFSSDLSSLASAWIPYFNFQYQGITK